MDKIATSTILEIADLKVPSMSHHPCFACLLTVTYVSLIWGHDYEVNPCQGSGSDLQISDGEASRIVISLLTNYLDIGRK
jgi:hypothetical protein